MQTSTISSITIESDTLRISQGESLQICPSQTGLHTSHVITATTYTRPAIEKSSTENIQLNQRQSVSSESCQRRSIAQLQRRPSSWVSSTTGFADSELPRELLCGILFLRKSEIRTGHNERIHQLCSRVMISSEKKLIEPLVNLLNWRRQQRLKIDWFIYILYAKEASSFSRRQLKFPCWTAPVARTFKIENIASEIISRAPSLRHDLRPSVDDDEEEITFPALDKRYLEYREPLLQLAKRVVEGVFSIDCIVAEIRAGTYVLGKVSHESLTTMSEQLGLFGWIDQEEELWRRRGF